MSPISLLMNGQVVPFLILAIGLVGALSLHEFGHAYAADRLGDPTARSAGRLTINPMKHLDPIGSAMLVLVGFGWAKPVPFQPAYLRSKRAGSAIVALAGPAMNLLLAIASIYVLRFVTSSWLFSVIGFFAQINILLIVFNLIPIPPLDGSRLLTVLLPPNKQHIIFFLDKWGFLILLALMFTVLPTYLPRMTSLLTSLLVNILP